jgi:predicted  nucleic acid-binding Zn-ribbon protein
MKLMHWQIAVAVTTLTTVGAGLAYMQASGDRAALAERLARLERDEAKGVPAAPKALAPARGGRDLDRELAETSARCRKLENELKTLQAENARLKAENEKLKQQAGAATAAADGQKGLPAQPSPYAMPAPGTGEPDQVVGAGGAIPTVNPQAPPGQVEPAGQPWGQAEDSEMDEMAAAVKLSPEQRQVIRQIIMDGQNEFERRLIEASQKGERDIRIIEQVGEEVSRKSKEKIRQVLYPEQLDPFEKYMKGKEEQR